MGLNIFKNTVLLFVLALIACVNLPKSEAKNQTFAVNEKPVRLQHALHDSSIVVGANQTETYIPLLLNKRVGIVANQTSVIFKEPRTKSQEPRTKSQKPRTKSQDAICYTHLVDSLLALNIAIKKVFAPEHGFRGTADAGELIKDGIDTKTNLPIISLYGANKKPSLKQLEDLDLLIFDIQDVGVRFYTYISTLHYIMEACAEAGISLLILDRPNPNGYYIDGPILEPEHKSFVGMHPIPITHGMTIGEYAQMINGEDWLSNSIKCALKIIPLKNYTHQTRYHLPIKPSPNLPNDTSINLYPSLCLFEGTNVSIGRGTNKQFQIVGTPFFHLKKHAFEFTPQPNLGASSPKHQGKVCHGYDLSNHEELHALNLSWLIEFYTSHQQYAPHETFFNDFFTKLAGTEKLQKQLEAGHNEETIRATWQNGLDRFKKTRETYLIYK